MFVRCSAFGSIFWIIYVSNVLLVQICPTSVRVVCWGIFSCRRTMMHFRLSFHGQAFDDAWSFRSCSFIASRRKNKSWFFGSCSFNASRRKKSLSFRSSPFNTSRKNKSVEKSMKFGGEEGEKKEENIFEIKSLQKLVKFQQ